MDYHASFSSNRILEEVEEHLSPSEMLNEGLESLKGGSDISIDVLDFSQSRDVRVEAKEDPDATENSSSFADTTSGNENNSGLSDAEVESQFCGEDDLAPPFDGFGSVFPIRKKKMTAHWRNFIHPLMWRCKWTELKIKELESQASKYARDISITDRGKHMTLDQVTVGESGSKSLPFTHPSHIRKPMKRMKRKRVEFTTDIASYMSKHVLFSERENKRGDLDGVPTLENHDNSDQHATGHDEFGIHDDCVFPEENNNYLEDVLHKIDLVHTRVNKLKDKLNLVMTKNASRFSSSENLSQLVACDGQTSSVHSPTLSACNGDTGSLGGLYISPYHITDFDDIVDFIMPLDSAVSSFGEAIPIPDIIESTVGLLSSIDVTQHHAHVVRDSSEKIVDNMLLHNEADEIEGSTLKNADDDENSVEEESNDAILLALASASASASESGVVDKGAATMVQSVLKSCLSSEIHFPKNKRKRGERKAGSGNWSRQRPGEPDN